MEEIKKWPIYFKENLICGNPKSEIGIATLFTPTQKIVEKISKEDFCVAGQLYSKEGINYILRNILANPSIRYLIVCGRDVSGSGKALVDFFEKGIDENYNIVGNKFAFIHKEISEEALELVRKNVKIKNLIGVQNPKEIIKAIRVWRRVGTPFAKPQLFPEPKMEEISTFPTQEGVFRISEKYIGLCWLRILKLILRFGTINESWYGNKTRELFNIVATISREDPFNPRIFPWFQVTKEDIEKYCSYIMNPKKGEEIYSYGERLFNYSGINQVDEIMVSFLKKYPNDRAAMAVIFDLHKDHKLPRSPCMCLVQATAQDRKINLTAYFRSHDIFSAWVVNAFGLRRLQHYIAQKLSKELGFLTIFSNCAHIYEERWKLAQEIVEKYGFQKRPYPFDSRGYFVISVDKKDIVAKLYSNEGKFLQEFRCNGLEEKAAIKMYNNMISAEAVSEISHAFDLGAELQKAEIAIKHNLKYIQDKDLIF